MTKEELRSHLDIGKSLVLRRKPLAFDGSREAEKLKREIQSWNSRAQALLNSTRGAKAAAAAFGQLGRMQYTSLADVKEQLKARRAIVSDFLGDKKTVKSPAKRETKPAPTKTPSPKVQKTSKTGERPYDVCLSFAGEDRKKAEQIYKSLSAEGLRVFYDEDEEVSADLWGKDLFVYLDDVYQNKARCCVMLISQHYSKKDWTKHERGSAQAREFVEQDYILPIRLDNTSIPGIRPTKGFRKWSEGVEKLTRAILIKLGRKPSKAVPSPQTKTKAPTRTKTPRPARHTILLGSQLWQVRHLERVPDQHITLRLKVGAQQLSKLRELASSRIGSPYIPFVNGFDAIDVQVSILKEETSAGRHEVSLKLTPKQAAHRYSYRLGWNGKSAADVATLAARQLLLGEKIIGDPYFSLPISLPTQLQEGIFPIAKKVTPPNGDVLQMAKLLGIYHLLSEGVVDVVKEMTFRKQSSGKISISFKGEILHSYGANKETVTVKGLI